jgi:uncharacterized repeat protein (TIGR01451 family)
MKYASKLLGVASFLTLAALGANPAFAAGTTAGSSITNTVSVNYKVGGLDQTSTGASDTLVVDRKINVTVAEVGSISTTVSPGQTNAVTAFTVTNNSNAVLDFALTATQLATGVAGAHSNVDSFNGTNVRIYLDNAVTGTVGSYDAGDTLVTYIDELAADASRTVFVVTDIPLSLTTGSVAAVALTATGREGGGAAAQGAALTETTGANTAAMDTVFADVAGSNDSARDAAHSARDDYTVLAAALTVLKTSTIISDPFNLTVNPKFIPGATLEYCIAVSNAAGGADATAVAISDTLPSTITYDSSYGIKINGTVSGGVCATDGTAGGSQSAGVVTGTLATVATGATRTILFRATIN